MGKEFCNIFTLKFELMYLLEMRVYDVTREPAKSQAKYTELHI